MLRAQLEHSWGMRLLWLTYSYKWEVAYLVSLICHDYLNISNYFGCNDHTLQLWGRAITYAHNNAKSLIGGHYQPELHHQAENHNAHSIKSERLSNLTTDYQPTAPHHSGSGSTDNNINTWSNSQSWGSRSKVWWRDCRTAGLHQPWHPVIGGGCGGVSVCVSVSMHK